MFVTAIEMERFEPGGRKKELLKRVQPFQNLKYTVKIGVLFRNSAPNPFHHMNGRGEKTFYRQDTGKVITTEDIYQMVMLRTYQQMPVYKIARKFSIKTIEARVLIGRRACGGCCG